MGAPFRPVPDEQLRRFGLALCQRLGLDPELVGDRIHWSVNSDEKHGQVDLTVHLPAEEILHMFNTGEPYIVPASRAEHVCRCGHGKRDHSNAREEDFGCNVVGCWDKGRCRGWDPQ